MSLTSSLEAIATQTLIPQGRTSQIRGREPREREREEQQSPQKHAYPIVIFCEEKWQARNPRIRLRFLQLLDSFPGGLEPCLWGMGPSESQHNRPQGKFCGAQRMQSLPVVAKSDRSFCSDPDNPLAIRLSLYALYCLSFGGRREEEFTWLGAQS